MARPATGTWRRCRRPRVQVDSWAGSWTFSTESDGTYAYWFNASANPLTLIAAKDGYSPQDAHGAADTAASRPERTSRSERQGASRSSPWGAGPSGDSRAGPLACAMSFRRSAPVGTGDVNISTKGAPVHSISPCLWFDNNLEEAAKFYTGIFPNSSVDHIARYNDAGAGEGRHGDGRRLHPRRAAIPRHQRRTGARPLQRGDLVQHRLQGPVRGRLLLGQPRRRRRRSRCAAG